MNRKNNKQFQSSDVRMKSAMLELMNSTPLEKITVRLICEKAGVNRSTFYAHYADIYDMIGQMERSLHSQLMADCSAAGSVNPLSRASLLTFLGFIREHRYFYRISLKARLEFPFRQGFAPLWEQVVQPMCRKAGIVSESEMMYCFEGFQAGFAMVLKRWVEQDCAEPEETLVRVIENLIPTMWKAPD